MKRIFIAAGGTGGHVFPGLAVADYLQQQGVLVEWLGGAKGLEQRLVAGKYPLHVLPMTAFRGGGVARKIKVVGALVRAFLQARKILRKQRASAVLVMGGYVSAPAGLAAKSLGIPLIIHEQNAVLGMANRYLGGLATQVFEAFPGTFPAARKAICSGNPLRPVFFSQQHQRSADGSLRVLVIGGSQGARAINEAVLAAGQELADLPIQWWHQTGVSEHERCQQAYATNTAVRCEAFIDDIPAAFAWADLVISRAGALSVSEISASGLASILVPYPYAVDDHQYQNAMHLVHLSAAWVIRERDLTAAGLAQRIRECYEQPERLAAMGEKARALSAADATAQVADCCLRVSKI